MIFIKILLSIFLVIGIIYPKFAWMIAEGWKFKDVEPSGLYLGMSRITAGIVLVLLWIGLPN